MAISSIGCGQTRDKDPLWVGLNLEITEFMANGTAKIIRLLLKMLYSGKRF